jgi:hypothetical protein
MLTLRPETWLGIWLFEKLLERLLRAFSIVLMLRVISPNGDLGTWVLGFTGVMDLISTENSFWGQVLSYSGVILCDGSK